MQLRRISEEARARQARAVEKATQLEDVNEKLRQHIRQLQLQVERGASELEVMKKEQQKLTERMQSMETEYNAQMRQVQGQVG